MQEAMWGSLLMPTYNYACASCGNEWEAQQRITEPALETCPKCLNKTAKRQISRGAGFILKGGGWYSDLYSSSGSAKKESGGGTGGTTAKTESSSAATTSTTPAATTSPAAAPTSAAT